MISRSIKSKVFERDGGCIFCNSGYFLNLSDIPGNSLTLHRINPGVNGGEYTLDNVVLVCKQHHLTLSDKSNDVIPKWGDTGMEWGQKNSTFLKHKKSMEKFIKDIKEAGWIN